MLIPRARVAAVAVCLSVAGAFVLLAGIDVGPLRWGGLAAVARLDRARVLDVTKAFVAIAAAAAVFYERHRVEEQRPIATREKRLVALALGLAAVLAYFGGVRPGAPRFVHRHDQFHYYLGAKYFAELGYDRLYRCTAIAEDEIGVVTFRDEDHIGVGSRRLDLRAEVRHADWKIRNLGGDNLLMPASAALEDPSLCKRHFDDARWAAFKADVLYFRLGADKGYWKGFSTDHGYNPPPVWTMGGWALASMFPAGERFDLPIVGPVVWLQALASIDVAYLAAMFAALAWAFGWRVCAASAIFWGCQASAPALWTNCAFLRQDWLFWLVFSVCLARKRWYAASGAALVYSALLRVFPGLVAIGWLVVAGHRLVKRRSLSSGQRRTLAGGALAAALLIPASIAVTGAGTYRDFYEHTLQIHDRTPLTNHMGLRVLVSQKPPLQIRALGVGVDARSGRVKFTKDDKLTDPFDLWKRMRNDRYRALRFVGYAVIALSLGAFVLATRRLRSMWIAPCLAVVFVILMAQLTSYYYSFLILLAPLTKAKRSLEPWLFGFAALTQSVFMSFRWDDDRYWWLTALSLVATYAVLFAFAPEDDRARVARLFRPNDPTSGPGDEGARTETRHGRA